MRPFVTDASLQIIFEKALKALLLYLKMRITGLIYVVIIFNGVILFITSLLICP